MKKNYFATNLKYLRNKRGLEQKDISNLLGLKSPTSVTNWERGDNLARTGHLNDLASYFGITIHQLVNEDLTKENNNIIDNTSILMKRLDNLRQTKVYKFAEKQLEEQNSVNESKEVYLVGRTAAGEPLSYGDQSFEKVSKNIPPKADCALQVQGDSMQPLIEDKSIIFYKKQPNVENGEVAIVEVDGEVTCKRFYKKDNQVVLKSENDKYDDLVIDEKSKVRVIGKVIL